MPDHVHSKNINKKHEIEGLTIIFSNVVLKQHFGFVWGIVPSIHPRPTFLKICDRRAYRIAVLVLEHILDRHKVSINLSCRRLLYQ